jgi:Zn-dependent M32 family carboxypeptidase
MNRVGVRVILGRRMMEAGDLTIAEKLEKIVDEIKGIKKANEMIRDKVRASDKDLERKDSVPNKRKRAQPAPSI